MNTDKIYAESIAKEYAPKKDSKVIALKKLDSRARRPAILFAYTCGILSSLIAGTGMCLAMQVIGSGTAAMVAGILIGVIGFAGCGINYPVFRKLLEKGKQKYAFEIMALAKEISEQ